MVPNWHKNQLQQHNFQYGIVVVRSPGRVDSHVGEEGGLSGAACAGSQAQQQTQPVDLGSPRTPPRLPQQSGRRSSRYSRCPHLSPSGGGPACTALSHPPSPPT